MTTPEWAAILARTDQSVLVMLGGVLAWALNWYVFTGKRARRFMTWVPVMAAWVVLGMELLR